MLNLILLLMMVGLLVAIIRGSVKNKKIAGDNLNQGKQYLLDNQKLVDVVTTASGLQYQPMLAGQGPHPNATDVVKVHYHGYLINNEVFDSSVERNQPISFGLNQVIAGWTEGLQLMQVGEKAKLVIPSELGYGSSNSGKIKANSVLIFEIELLAINP